MYIDLGLMKTTKFKQTLNVFPKWKYVHNISN